MWQKPLLRNTPSQSASAAISRAGWNGRDARNVTERMPYSSVSGTWPVPASSWAPAGRLRGGDRVVATGVEHLGQLDHTLSCVQQAGGRVHPAQHGVERRELLAGHEVGLGDHQQVRELDLVDQQVPDGALLLLLLLLLLRGGQVALGQVVASGQLAQEACRVHQRHHRVQLRVVG
jgi:hypothetical protein